MSLMLWDYRLETGDALIDSQHQALVEALNRLHSAMLEESGRSEVGSPLKFLSDYTVSHFRMEEEMMDWRSYPGESSHRKIHGDLIASLKELVAGYQRDSTALTIATMIFLEE
jgi:hemerythrin-like metal-binding protein